jgi:hypothetical protein
VASAAAATGPGSGGDRRGYGGSSLYARRSMSVSSPRAAAVDGTEAAVHGSLRRTTQRQQSTGGGGMGAASQK